MTSNIWAKPKNIKNPPTSVQVVINIVAEVAGSLPSRFMISGMVAPATVAIIRLPIIESANTKPSIGLLLINIATKATIKPLITSHASHNRHVHG